MRIEWKDICSNRWDRTRPCSLSPARRCDSGVLLMIKGLRSSSALVAFAVAPLMLVAVGISQTESTKPGPQSPAELWLSWSSDAKAEYVWGFLSGFTEGKRAGCTFYAGRITPYMPHKPTPPEKLPRQECLNALLHFREPHFQTYVDVITNYYTKYPRDREAGLARILLEMVSVQNLSIDQIHAKIAPGH